jgi:hypothetical protein
MTFSAGKVTTRLVDGKVIFWTREMDGGNEPEETVVGLPEGRFTGRRLSPVDFDQAAPLRIPLLDQIAFHLRILS